MKLIKLNIGSGSCAEKDYIGIDIRRIKGVDIVCDLEKFPYPLTDGCCSDILANQVFEHIKPWLSIKLMNELWRLLVVGGRLGVGVPYPGSERYWQDPTHCNGWNEMTWQYFDSKYPLYFIYKPSPWHIQEGYPHRHENGDLQVVLEKVN